MEADDFGNCMLTYPIGFYLPSMFVRSIERVSQGIRIIIIPGDGKLRP